MDNSLLNKGNTDKSDHVFLYNISLETFNESDFKNIWLNIYGDSKRNIEKVNIILPIPLYGNRSSELQTHFKWTGLGKLASICTRYSHIQIKEEAEQFKQLCERIFFSVYKVNISEVEQADYAFAIYIRDKSFKTSHITELSNLIYEIKDIYAYDVGTPIIKKIEEMEAKLNNVKKTVRHILGTPIGEPFTRYNNKDHTIIYNWLLGIPNKDNSDIIADHLKKLALVWNGRDKPDLDYMQYFNYVPDEKEVPLHMAAAWAFRYESNSAEHAKSAIINFVNLLRNNEIIPG